MWLEDLLLVLGPMAKQLKGRLLLVEAGFLPESLDLNHTPNAQQEASYTT